MSKANDAAALGWLLLAGVFVALAAYVTVGGLLVMLLWNGVVHFLWAGAPHLSFAGAVLALVVVSFVKSILT